MPPLTKIPTPLPLDPIVDPPSRFFGRSRYGVELPQEEVRDVSDVSDGINQGLANDSEQKFHQKSNRTLPMDP